MRGKFCFARVTHSVPDRTVWMLGYFFLLCVGGLALTCGAQPFDTQPPPRPANTVEPPVPLKPDPPPPSGPSPDRTSSESRPGIVALNDEELEVARQLVRDYPNDANPLGFLGNIYSKHGLNKEAVRYWEQSLRIDPNRAMTYDAMATAALSRQEYDRALELARKAVSLDPTLTSSRRRVAESLIALGKHQE